MKLRNIIRFDVFLEVETLTEPLGLPNSKTRTILVTLQGVRVYWSKLVIWNKVEDVSISWEFWFSRNVLFV